VVQSKYNKWSFHVVRIAAKFLGVSNLLRATVMTGGVAAALAVVVSASVVVQSTQPTQSTQSTKATTSRSKTVFTGKLPVLDGQQLTATLVEVTYPPGGANPAHRHPCPVIGYVLEGAVRMQVQGQAEKIFKAGESFFESPDDVHAVSANASQNAPARFLAYFVCDRATPLSVPVSEQRGEE
jgi:quercetin dioxygenase-like cupin family protein